MTLVPSLPRPATLPPRCRIRTRVLPAILLLAGCSAGDNLLLPGNGQPTAIEVVSGNGQSGRVGEHLSDPVVVKVTDSQGRPVPGASVEFAFTDAGPGAALDPATATTGGDGEADSHVTLGTRMGPQTGEARVVSDGAEATKASFTLTALSENANGMAAVSGDNQTGAASSTLANPLVVEVTDAFGNPISGVPISWTALGGGSVSEASVTTDDQGLASVTRQLGPAAGEQTTQASSEGLAGSPVTFTHTATAGNASVLSIVSGDNQTAEVGTQLPADLVVRLVDAQGNGVPNTAVTWLVSTGGGSVTPENGMTDDAGRSSAQWTLGPNPGSNRIDAVVSGVGIVSFTATGTAAAPAALFISTQPSSTARNGERLERQPVVQVRDTRGNNVATAGIEITAQLSGGSGALTGTSQQRTDASGRASFTDLAIVGATGRRTLVFTAAGYAGAISNDIDVRPISTTTTITSDAPDPSVAGTAFTIQFQVSSDGPTPTGTVTVTVSDSPLSCSSILQGGTGSCSLTLNQPGDRTLRATYSGGSGFNASSATEKHQVNTTQPQNRAPKADFNWHCDALDCQFTDKSTDPDGNGTIVAWSWNFGDPASGATNSSSTPSPSHHYSAPGRYTVTLTVTDNAGASNTASTQNVEAKAPENKAPHAEFEVACPNPDLSCTFTDKSSDDGSVTGWHWDFGDGQSADLQNSGSTSHTYATAGIYHVTLTVTDNGGATGSKTHDAHPKAPPANQPPVAQFTSSCSNLACSFNDGSTDDKGVATWSWSFGDAASGANNTSNVQNPSHTFSGGGKFTVTLTVTDAEGLSNSVSHDVDVTPANQPPTAGDDAATTDAGVPVTINVLANDSDPEGAALTITSVSDPPGGSAVNNGNGTITYTPDAGFSGNDSFTYTVSDGSLSAQATVTVTVNAPPPPPNQAPSFTLKSSDLSANVGESRVEDGWAQNISPGPPSESGQTVTFLVSNDRADLFTSAPAISPSGTLSFTAASTNGDSIVTVQAMDNGGTANGGVDTSAPQTFTIHISGGSG